jgi:hypothetical protein
MTQRAIRKLAVLRAATLRYSPRVQTKLCESGSNSDSALVTASAAKYYVALKKLAKK